MFSTPVNFGTLSNVEIKILGNLALPKSIPCMILYRFGRFASWAHELAKDVQALVNASGGSLPWFTIAGNNVTLSGNQDPSWGFIDSFGYQWWEAAAHTSPLGGLVSDFHALYICKG
jgi:hypothetical protein